MTDSAPPSAAQLHHRLRRMTGRDTLERHRTATPLELLFDLSFVVAFGLAADQTAHLLAEGHFAAALGGFAFAMFAVVWAWVNFTWFASAFDGIDWSDPDRVPTSWTWRAESCVPQNDGTYQWTTFDHGETPSNDVAQLLARADTWARATYDLAARAEALNPTTMTTPSPSHAVPPRTYSI